MSTFWPKDGSRWRRKLTGESAKVCYLTIDKGVVLVHVLLEGGLKETIVPLVRFLIDWAEIEAEVRTW